MDKGTNTIGKRSPGAETCQENMEYQTKGIHWIQILILN